MKIDFWEKAKEHLCKKDKKLNNIITSAGNVYLETSKDPFVTLFNSILGQQISVAAAGSIKKRITSKYKITPKSFFNAKLMTLEIVVFLE